MRHQCKIHAALDPTFAKRESVESLIKLQAGEMGTAETNTQLQFDANHDVSTLNEAAKFLKVSERTLWSLAKEGLVPFCRVGKQYRLSRNVLVRWIQNGDGYSGPETNCSK